MWLTVLENKPFVHESFGSFLCESKTITTTDRSGIGDVLTVLAVELPYIVVRKESAIDGNGWTWSIDTRRTTLMELGKDYVHALLPRLNNKTPEPAKI